MNTRFFVLNFLYYILPLILILVGLIISSEDFYITLGAWALQLVLIILFMKPLAIIFELGFLMRCLTYRRELGLAAFWFALFHGVGLMYMLNLISSKPYLSFSSYLFWGAVALLGMVILGVTSNNFSMRLLKRNWKRLQYLAYPTFFAILLHVAMIEREYLSFFITTALFIILKTLEWKRVKLSLFKRKTTSK